LTSNQQPATSNQQPATMTGTVTAKLITFVLVVAILKGLWLAQQRWECDPQIGMPSFVTFLHGKNRRCHGRTTFRDYLMHTTVRDLVADVAIAAELARFCFGAVTRLVLGCRSG
jgi:hypothetical protein